MTSWISRRPIQEVAAHLAGGRGPLAGVRFVLRTDADDEPSTPGGPLLDALAAAGAVLVGQTEPGADTAAAIAAGDADMVLDVSGAAATCIPRGGVAITPTAAVAPVAADPPGRGCPLTLVASGLELANRAMRVAAAGSAPHWPADTRLAAPPRPVVAVPRESTRPARAPEGFDAVLAGLRDRGSHLVDVDVSSLPPAVLDGVDVLVVPTAQLNSVSGVCAVSVPIPGGTGQAVSFVARPYGDALALDLAALATGSAAPAEIWPAACAETAELVVFGAHMRGGPLTHQLTDLGARFQDEITTSARYRMTVLDTVPVKPAVTRVRDGVDGVGLTGHRWLLSPAALGRFLAALPPPMQLGKVEFDDGTWRTAFSCDGAAATGRDISRYGSWPAAVAAGAV